MLVDYIPLCLVFFPKAFGFCEAMTHLEIAVDNLDCRMIALLLLKGAHPKHNVFDGHYIHHPQRAEQGFFTEYVLLSTFDGIHRIPGFEGLHALLPRLPPWQGGDTIPVKLLLNAVESATKPLPRWGTLSLRMPPGTRCSRLFNSTRVCTGSVCAAGGSCWTDFSVEHFQHAVVAQLAIAKFFVDRFGVCLPEVACRIAALVMKEAIWTAVEEVSRGDVDA